MPVIILWLTLLLLSLVILFTSRFLVRSADMISEKTNLGRSFVGVLLLATATSLPELGTGISSITLVGQPDLAAGDAFGSNLFNLLIIGALDMYWRHVPILDAVTKSSMVVAVSGICLILISCIAIFIHGTLRFGFDWPISPLSLILITVFMASMYAIYRQDRIQPGIRSAALKYDSSRLSVGILMYAISAGTMVITSVMLANTGHSLSEALNWDASFVGSQFLALSTSLPELATSIAAVKLGAPELAVSNVLGSNMFNMGFVLFMDELAYSQGVFWSAISNVHMLTCVFGILMTVLVIFAVQRTKQSARVSGSRVFGMVMLLMYLSASISIFGLSQA